MNGCECGGGGQELGTPAYGAPSIGYTNGGYQTESGVPSVSALPRIFGNLFSNGAPALLTETPNAQAPGIAWAALWDQYWWIIVLAVLFIMTRRTT